MKLIYRVIVNQKDSMLRTHDHWHTLLQLADIFLFLHYPLNRCLKTIVLKILSYCLSASDELMHKLLFHSMKWQHAYRLKHSTCLLLGILSTRSSCSRQLPFCGHKPLDIQSYWGTEMKYGEHNYTRKPKAKAPVTAAEASDTSRFKEH